jgi:hypothetical protein
MAITRVTNRVIADNTITEQKLAFSLLSALDLGFRPIQGYGGVETTQIVNDRPWKYHTFTNIGNSTFVVASTGSQGLFEYLVIAGGGGGGGSWSENNLTYRPDNALAGVNYSFLGVAVGGGGGGGFVVTNFGTGGVLARRNSTYNIQVGSGGTGGYGNNNGTNGGYSELSGTNINVLCQGGGGGGHARIGPNIGGTFTSGNGASVGNGGGGGKGYTQVSSMISGNGQFITSGTGGTGALGGNNGGTPTNNTYIGGGGGGAGDGGNGLADGTAGTGELVNVGTTNITYGPGGLSPSPTTAITVDGVSGAVYGAGGQGAQIRRSASGFAPRFENIQITINSAVVGGGTGFQGVVIIRYPLTA